MMSALDTTAVLAKAIFPAAVVVNMPVGMIVIWPPFVNPEGGVIVSIAATPDTNAIGVVISIVPAEATVGMLAETLTGVVMIAEPVTRILVVVRPPLFVTLFVVTAPESLNENIAAL